jgi:hypothetical protein
MRTTTSTYDRNKEFVIAIAGSANDPIEAVGDGVRALTREPSHRPGYGPDCNGLLGSRVEVALVDVWLPGAKDVLNLDAIADIGDRTA